jgi:hypothetical protein
MEHPLVGNLDELSVDQLSTQISDLSRKLGIASRSGNAHLCNQIRMALESYQNKYHEKLQSDYAKKLASAKIDTTKIDIQ